jgi:hypothetical protein
MDSGTNEPTRRGAAISNQSIIYQKSLTNKWIYSFGFVEMEYSQYRSFLVSETLPDAVASKAIR